MMQAMVLSSFLVACVAFMAAVIHLKKVRGDDDLDGVRASTPGPLPTLPRPAAEPPAPAAVPLSPAAAPIPPAAAPAPLIEPAPVADSPQPAARPVARSAKNSGSSHFSTARTRAAGRSAFHR